MTTVARRPRVLVGLPVYNGEAYLRQAIDSILGQTFTDFQLFIADNASTDGTAAICQSYAARDRRVRYHRHAANIGAMQNWYYTFRSTPSEYFIGAAHDDVMAPEFLQRCVEVLEARPDVVVCFSRAHIIDATGTVVGCFEAGPDTASAQAHQRLYNVLAHDLLCQQLLGVMRSSAFASVTPYAGYYGSDRNVLIELALRGAIFEIPELLFQRRLHAGALGAAANTMSAKKMKAWDPGGRRGSLRGNLTRLLHYGKAIATARLPLLERIRCFAQFPRLLASRAARRIRRQQRWLGAQT